MKIYPSLISADLLRLGEVIAALDTVCDGYHLDVMDYHFVPNLTWGPAFINAIRKVTKLPLHVHLMIQNPAAMMSSLALHADDTCIIHYEAVAHDAIPGLLQAIRACGWRAGIAINPKTPVSVLTDLVSYCDEVLVMSVEPGFSGQQFIEVTHKVTELVQLRNQSHTEFSIAMDGGITTAHVARLAALGVDAIGAAGAIFGRGDMLENIRALRAAID